MTLWWLLWTAGVLVLAVQAYGTIRAYRGRPVPSGRAGWPGTGEPSHRPPWWSWALFVLGIAVIVVASESLSRTLALADLAYLLPGLVSAFLLQAAILRAHNRRVEVAGTT